MAVAYPSAALRPFCKNLLFLGLLLVSGCSPAPTADTELSTSGLARHLNRLAVDTTPADTLAAARRAQHAAVSLAEAGLQPAIHPSFLVTQRGTPHPAGVLPDPARSHVLGYVPGRNPRYAAELVLVTADIDRLAAAALLEVARLLAAEARTHIVPDATVGFLLFAPPHTDVAGVNDFLSRPTWSLAAIHRVIHVTTRSEEAPALASAWARAGIPMEVVTPIAIEVPDARREGAIQVATAYRLVQDTLHRVRSVAARPIIPVTEAGANLPSE
jgi:hypothetical protein